MKKAILIASALLVSSTAFAATVSSKTEIELDGYQNQTQAYEAGFAELVEYQAMDNHELAYALKVSSKADSGSVSINDTEIRVEQFATQLGEIQYRPVVEISFSYDLDV